MLSAADLPLVLAGLGLGLAASPHCVVMCSAPCAALTRGCARRATGFQAGRLLGYMLGGAVAAGSVAAMGALAQTVPVLRPLWTMGHLGFFLLGLAWLITGRPLVAMSPFGATAKNPQAVKGPAGTTLRSALAGLAWVMWPCGVLQGALLVAALANGPAAGALVMGAFALGSMPALAAAPWLWRRLRVQGAGAASVLRHRASGLGLALGSGMAIRQSLWPQFVAWCGS